jgi:alcohol dehydrogenase class IV
MWFFNSPRVVFGEDALSWLAQTQGSRAFIVTDETIQRLGYVERVQRELSAAGMETAVFSGVEPDPGLDTVQTCARLMEDFNPDWVVGLGGGSCMDAAKAAWFLYERPDVDPQSINPIEQYGLRKRARLIAIPTTAGSGSEASQAAVIKDPASGRKMELASYEIIPDMAIIDPSLSAGMPPRLTADVGIDVLTHAVEVFTCVWPSDYLDGLALHATRLVFNYLPRAVAAGAADMEARQKMANAATIAGICIANANIALAHVLGHSAGSVFNLPHGRATAIFLPLAVEYISPNSNGRFVDLACAAGLPRPDVKQAAGVFAGAVRELMQQVGLPLSLQQAGVDGGRFETELDDLCNHAELDLGMMFTPRPPAREDMERLFRCALDGTRVDF